MSHQILLRQGVNWTGIFWRPLLYTHDRKSLQIDTILAALLLSIEVRIIWHVTGTIFAYISEVSGEVAVILG